MKTRAVMVVAILMAASVTLLAETSSYFNRNYDFSTLKTWDFKVQRRISRDPLADNELWARMIRDEISANLRRIGYEQTSEQPDFLVGFYVGLKERYTTQHMDYGFPGHWGPRRFAWIWGWPDRLDVWRVPYTDSTLIIDVIDAPTNMLVWRGFNTRTIDMGHPNTALDKGVDRVIQRFLKDTRPDRRTNN